MARLHSIGFELNSATNGVEITTVKGDSGGTAPTISTTVANTGTYSYKSTCSSSDCYSLQTISAGAGTLYARAYIYVTSLPSSNSTLLALGTASVFGGGIFMNSSGALGLVNNANTYFTNLSSAISLNTWYYIELEVVATSSNAQTMTGRLNGVQFDTENTTTTLAANAMTTLYWGNFMSGTENGTVTMYFDDLVLNDNTGSNQNTFPGAGHLLRYSPNAAGDSNGFLTNVGGTVGTSNNFTRVDEVTPDNATSYNASITAASDLFAVGAIGGSLPAGATINVVQVGARIANITGADTTASLQLQIEQASGGTISKSGAIIPDTTTFSTNSKNTPHNYPLTLYQDPTSTNWTTSTIASMQIGYLVDFSHTDALAISTVWAYVDYTPSSSVNASVTQVAATVTATGGSQSVSTVNNVTMSQSNASVTATGGTQAVAAVQDAVVTQSGASVTVMGGTQLVATVQNVSISQVSASVTATGKTQVVASINIVAISQVAANVTVTGGTQGIQDVQDVVIAQVGAVLTVTGGTQTVTTLNNSNISQVAANVIARGGVQSVRSNTPSTKKEYLLFGFKGGRIKARVFR